MQNQSVNQPASQSIDHRIHQSVRKFRPPFETEKEAALNSLLSKIDEARKPLLPVQRRLIWVRTASGIAASLLIGVVLWVFLSTEQIRNEGKQVATFRLPDESRIVLSPNGTVSYKTYFWNKQIRLKGKAYFEVEKGGKFKVSAPTGSVEVLGTRFTVEGFEKELQVVCFEGKVRVNTSDAEELLLPGNGIRSSAGAPTKQIKKEESYPDFAQFKVSYHNKELKDILSDISQFFNIEIDNQITQSRYFTGSIYTGNPDIVLSILTGSLGLEYKKTSENVIRIFSLK